MFYTSMSWSTQRPRRRWEPVDPIPPQRRTTCHQAESGTFFVEGSYHAYPLAGVVIALVGPCKIHDFTAKSSENDQK